MMTRQYARVVAEWIGSIGLDPRLFGTHSLRRTKATLIYRRPLRDWSTPGQRPCLYRARNLLRLKRRPDPGLEQPQPRLQSESLEGLFEIVQRLSQVRPAVAMQAAR